MNKMKSMFLILAISMLPALSFGGEEGDGSGLRALAVQNRQHTGTHEFTAFVGTLPIDAFTKGLTFTGAYTIHFSNMWAWEVGQFTYSYGINTDLYDDLASLPQPVEPTPFEVIKFYVTTGLVWKPIYGKLAVLNKKQVFGELYLGVYGGYAKMTITDRPIAGFGGGFRVYLGSVASIRLDIRDYMAFNAEDIKNELWIALGLGLSFG